MTDLALVAVVLLVIVVVVYYSAIALDQLIRRVQRYGARRRDRRDLEQLAAFVRETRAHQAAHLGIDVRDMRWYGR